MRATLIIVVWLALIPVVAGANPLAGIGEIGGVTVHLDDEAKREGLTEEPLLEAIEIGLGRNNVPYQAYGPYTAPFEEMTDAMVTAESLTRPGLHVAVQAIELSPDLPSVIFSIRVELWGIAYVIRTNTAADVILWQDGYFGMTNKDELREHVRAIVLKKVDDFSLAYLRANAKK